MGKITTRKDGYQVFWNDGKIIYLHRYLAEKHIPNPDNKCCVNHKDGNPSNNSLDNLEWVSKRENCEHARLNGFSETKSYGIKSLSWEEYVKIFNLRKDGMSYRKIADVLNLEYRRVYDIYNGKRYKDFYSKLKTQ
jgi:hypothetical protein